MAEFNAEQYTFMSIYVAYLWFVYFTQYSIIARPIRLLTTFIHEFSHALACWLTGGEEIIIISVAFKKLLKIMLIDFFVRFDFHLYRGSERN